MPKIFLRIKDNFRLKITYFCIGVFVSLLVVSGAYYIWNPTKRVQQETKWLNERIYGATNIFDRDLQKINEARLDNYQNWTSLRDEFNKPVPDEKVIQESVAKIRIGLSKISTNVDTACNEYRTYIFSDPKDAQQRGKDADKLCELLNGFKEAINLEEEALTAILDSRLDLNTRAEQHKNYINKADQVLITTLKQIGEFESSSLNP